MGASESITIAQGLLQIRRGEFSNASQLAGKLWLRAPAVLASKDSDPGNYQSLIQEFRSGGLVEAMLYMINARKRGELSIYDKNDPKAALYYMLITIGFLTMIFEQEFVLEFVDENGIKAALGELSDQVFLNAIRSNQENDPAVGLMVQFLCLLLIIGEFDKRSSIMKEQMKESNYVGVLVKYTKMEGRYIFTLIRI